MLVILAISIPIPKAKLELDTTHLNLRFRKTNDVNYENDASTIDS
jgi:hypothetical protein